MKVLFGSIVVGVALFAVAAGAKMEAETVAKRQEIMKGNGGHMKAIKDYVESGQGSLADVRARAEAIRASMDSFTGMFPEGTSADDMPGKSEALAAIWSDGAGFEAAAETLRARAGALAAAAHMGDSAGVKNLFGKLGREGCGGCHGKFRLKTP
jgi:cytochrome c556